jgi:hypothetical protein
MRRLNIIIVAIAVLGLVVLAACPSPMNTKGTPSPSPSPGNGSEAPAGEPAYHVTYDGNGASGSAPVDNNTYRKGAAVTVIPTAGSLIKPNCALAGWTTQPTGLGESYVADVLHPATFTMGDVDIALHAFWLHKNLICKFYGTRIVIIGWIPGLTGSVTIPEGVTDIISGAFSGCADLTDISLPASVIRIDAAAFDRCTGLTSISVDAGNPAFESVAGALFDKTGRALVAVPSGSIAGSYVVPPGVTAIGPWAFASSATLTDVSIPASVTSIDSSAFQCCSGLTSISVHPGNPSFESISGALYDKTGTVLLMVPKGLAGSYAIPPSVTSVGANTFYTCQKLTGIDIPSSVTEIGAHAFDFCTGLTEISIPGSVSSIGDYAFYDCYSLNEVIIGPGVASIGASAFIGCKLGSVTIPEGLTNIGDSAFGANAELTSITIPASVTRIGKDNFHASFKLIEISVAPSNPNYESIDGALIDKTEAGLALMRVPNGKSGRYDIPAGVAFIGNAAIAGCSALTEITIPDGVTGIGQSAFSYCAGLNAIVIPSSVSSIGEYAFSCSSGLNSVTLEADSPPGLPSGSQAFSGCASGLKIHVPAIALATYQAAEGWKEFALKIVSP